jgi:hypothetical protein
MNSKKILSIIFVMMLSACASSGPVPMGQDTFMITKQSSTGFHSGGSVKAEIFREANDYCLKQGLQFQPITERAKDGVPGYAFANAELVFRCLVSGDSEIRRPTPKQMPSVIIENRNR